MTKKYNCLFVYYLQSQSMRKEDHQMSHTLNSSTFRRAFKFSTASRFPDPHNSTTTDFNYDVASKRNSRSTSFGVGPRPVMINSMAAPNPNRYNVSEFPTDRRATTLGEGRQRANFRSMAHEIQKKMELPSPDTYDCVQPKRNGWSLRVRLPGEAEEVVRRRVPGPGEYKQVEMNKLGKYYTSKIKNTRSISFGTPRQEYLKRTDTKIGPGSYDVFGDSEFSENRVHIMRRNMAKQFGTGGRRAVEDRSKLGVPGPGQYDSYSSFTSTFVPNVS